MAKFYLNGPLEIRMLPVDPSHPVKPTQAELLADIQGFEVTPGSTPLTGLFAVPEPRRDGLAERCLRHTKLRSVFEE